jgi:hypothetical protein
MSYIFHSKEFIAAIFAYRSRIEEEFLEWSLGLGSGIFLGRRRADRGARGTLLKSR